MHRFTLLRLSAFLLMVTFVAPIAEAQMLASERSQVHQRINGVDVVIDYSRPSVRGRSPIWGNIEPWGTVWTPGADMSTTLKVTKAVKLNGVDISAGKYEVWFELLENEPWNLLLMRDTTLFHVPYPSRDSAFVATPMHPEEAPSFVETLRFDFENVRVNGADIQFRWGDTLVPIRLDVDPEYDMVLSADEAAPYPGDWLLDISMDAPSDSLLAVWSEGLSESEMVDFNKWTSLDHVLHDVHFSWDAESGHLRGHNRSIAALFDDPSYSEFVLIRKGEGIFVEGGMMDGELMFVGEYKLWEFEFDNDGQAVELVQRARQDDRVMGRAERAR